MNLISNDRKKETKRIIIIPAIKNAISTTYFK